MGGERFLRPLIVLVAAHAMATAAGAVLVAGRGDDPRPAVASTLTTGPVAGTAPAVGPAPTAARTSATAGAPPPAARAVDAGALPAASGTAPSRRPCPQLRALPTRAKLAQLLFVGVGDAASAKAALGGASPAGGVLVLGRGRTWFASGVLRSIAAGAVVAPVVAADEEGGRVQRIDGVYGPIPSASQQGRRTPSEVRALAQRRGRQLRDLGFTMDLAPVVDLAEPGNAIINSRAFGAEPAKVITYGTEFAAGLQDAGITPVLKHFPGHGRSTGDSHKQSVATPALAQLRTADLKPFVALAHSTPAVMVGHLDVPGLTEPGRPASVSPQAIGGLLRTEIGFDGLVLTDDLSGMKAITDRFTVADAVVASIAAGADVAIVAFGAGQSLDPLLASLERAIDTGRLPMARVDQALDHLGAVKPGCR